MIRVTWTGTRWLLFSANFDGTHFGYTKGIGITKSSLAFGLFSFPLFFPSFFFFFFSMGWLVGEGGGKRGLDTIVHLDTHRLHSRQIIRHTSSHKQQATIPDGIVTQ